MRRVAVLRCITRRRATHATRALRSPSLHPFAHSPRASTRCRAARSLPYTRRVHVSFSSAQPRARPGHGCARAGVWSVQSRARYGDPDAHRRSGIGQACERRRAVCCCTVQGRQAPIYGDAGIANEKALLLQSHNVRGATTVESTDRRDRPRLRYRSTRGCARDEQPGAASSARLHEKAGVGELVTE